MTRKQKQELLKAAELIAREKEHAICPALNRVGSELNIRKDPVCRMFYTSKATWWGVMTMGIAMYSPEARNARLLGIAFMLTMPNDMIEADKDAERNRQETQYRP